MADPEHRGADSITYRCTSAGIGVILIVCAVFIVALMPFSDGWAMIGAGILFALGVDALVAAKKGRWSVLSRIGPLP